MQKQTIKLFVMDVDGTLTDGKIYMGNDGEVMKAFDIKDGCGIHDILPTVGIIPCIITGRESRILEMRCGELGIQSLYQGVRDKKTQLDNVLRTYNISISEVAYIGDDINDLACMQIVKDGGGIIGCPADAVPAVKAIANYVCKRNGGNGAVREFIDYLCLS